MLMPLRTLGPLGAAKGGFNFLNNLVAYWKLSEASGTRSDSVGSSHLSPSGTPGNVAGKLGNALQLVRASSQSLSVADSAGLSTGNIHFTLAAWVYLDTRVSGLAGETILSKWHYATNNREFILWFQSQYGAPYTEDRFNFGISSDGTTGNTKAVGATALGLPSTGTWYFIVAWHDSTADTINIQVNNGTVNSAPAGSTGVLDGDSNFEIGSYYSNDHWNGRVDDVMFWKNRILTASERTALYGGGNGLALF